MTKSHDVIIVGGGIVGSASAYYLKKHGFTGSVALIERDTTYQRSCTALSAGGIRQQFSTPENIALSLFGLNLVRNLKQEFGPEADAGFKELGYLILASDSGAPILEQNHALQMAHGANNVLLGPDALAERFPWLVPEGVALGCFGQSGEGWMDPYSMMALFRKAAIAQGVELVADEVAAVARNDGTVTGVTLKSGQALSCGTLVNAAGWGAGALAAMAGLELPVGPRKRYVYVIDSQAAADALHRAPLTVQPNGVWFRPEGRNFICGVSPEEHEEPTVFDWDVDYTMWEERVWPGLAERVPAFEAVKVINAWVGHYDYNTFDQNGIIGRHPDAPNFILANGFSGHGFQQGPASGNAVAELIMYGSFRAIDLTRLGFERIRNNAPLFEKNVI